MSQSSSCPKPWNDPAAKPYLRLHGVNKIFGDVKAVDNISLDIYSGEFFALLGPSGCGKTTLLRMMAGFETPNSGQIFLEDQDLTRIPPHARPVNMMFQSYALFPHMSVEKNIAFGLEMEGMKRGVIKERVEEMLTLTRLEKFARRKPDQLSGGQRQRVALARALAKKPKLLLLDEPLGALDRKLREATQFELVNIQEKLGMTFVIVTHDQEEAMTVSTRLAVMREGTIAQMGTPETIYEAPNSRYVADFIGDVNILQGQVTDQASGRIALERDRGEAVLGRPCRATGAIAVAIRPEKIVITRAGEPGTRQENHLAGVVEDIAYLGNTSIYHVRVPDHGIIRVERTNRARVLEQDISWEAPVDLNWDGSAMVELQDP